MGIAGERDVGSGEAALEQVVRASAGSVSPLARSFYPVAIGLAIAVCLLLSAHGAPGSSSLVTGAVSLGCLAVFLVAERVMPFRADWNQSRGDWISDTLQTNVALPVMAQVLELVIGLALTWLAAHHYWRAVMPNSWPFAAQATLALLTAEFFYYWLHRLGHTWTGLWRFHAVHHGASRLYSLNAGRFHLVDTFLSTLAYVGPMLVLGVPVRVTALVTTLNAVTGFLEHANIAFEAGRLNRIFNTAQLHRWHHATGEDLTPSNFGKVLSIWDQVFGTWYFPDGQVIEHIGINADEAPVPVTWWAQTLYPWKAR